MDKEIKQKQDAELEALNECMKLIDNYVKEGVKEMKEKRKSFGGIVIDSKGKIWRF